MNINSAAKLVVVALCVIPELVTSICTGSEFWNPLNNACVTCNIIINMRMPMA